jgi:hypothetical protein
LLAFAGVGRAKPIRRPQPTTTPTGRKSLTFVRNGFECCGRSVRRYDRRWRRHRFGSGRDRVRLDVARPRARYEGRKAGRGARIRRDVSRLGIAIRAKIPVAIVALLPIVAIAFVPILERAILARTSILKPVALAILPGREAASVIAALTLLTLVLRPLGKGLRGVRRGVRLRLEARWLGLLESVLPLGGGSETIGQRVKIAVIVHAVLVLPGRPLLTALRKRLRSLRGGDEPEVMLGVLQIIFRGDRVSARMSVSCELEVFFRDVVRVAAYFHVWSIRFVGSRQRIWAAPVVRRPSAHPLILTWSHFDFPIIIRLATAFPIVRGPKLFKFDTREALHRFASPQWADLITSDPRT